MGRLCPQGAFELLDDLISALDEVVEAYGMYKYQHVNDTYLVTILHTFSLFSYVYICTYAHICFYIYIYVYIYI